MPVIILPDHETRVDLLNTEPIAVTIAELIRSSPGTPMTIGVHGDWGAGKSSVLEMVDGAFGGDKETLCIKFNGWRFQGFEDAKVVLLEGIVDALVKERSLLTNASEKVKSVFRRIDWLKVAKHSGGLAWTAFTGIPTPDQIRTAVAALQSLTTDPAAILTKENLASATSVLSGVLKEPVTKHVPEEVEEFRKEFDELLTLAGIDQLVVLVDDLDRCLPDTAIETLEAIRLFVFTSRTAFIVAADEAMIEYSVRKHFPDLPESTGPRSYARNYLEKLIQVPFRIPALGVAETRIYTTLLLVGAEIGESSETFTKLIQVARGFLKRPWEGRVIGQSEVRAIMNPIPPGVQQALTLGEQIGPVLAEGTLGNPRQIKRFLNSMLLRQRIASARGFGDDVKVPPLAKLMLAERFQHRLFEHIAQSASRSPTGVCEDLVPLEAAARPEQSAAAPKTGRKSASAPEPEKPQLPEWLQAESVLAWAAISPPLAAVDLRPYLFVTKDRRGYLGGLTASSHLEEIANQLVGPELVIRGMEPRLKSLKTEELEMLFELLRARVIQGDSFERKPDGILGMIALVKTHPILQGRLVDFLESLPRDRLGTWATMGWAGVFADGAVERRFAALLSTWESHTENKALSGSAKQARALQKGPG